MKQRLRVLLGAARGLWPSRADFGSAASSGVESLLLDGAKRMGIVLFVAITIVDTLAVASGLADLHATLLYDGLTLLGVAVAGASTRIAKHFPELPLFAMATVLNISLIFGVATLNAGHHEVGLLCVAVPIGVAAFAPLHPLLMIALGIEVVALLPFAERIAPPGWSLDSPIVAALAIAIAGMGASASRSQRAVWARFGDAHERALQSTRTKSEFLANMSHEIRSPMTAILGFADELERKIAVLHADAETLEALHTIQRNGAHLLDLINRILDLSKVEAGKLPVLSAPCSPASIVREVVQLLGPQARTKGVRLETRCDGPIPGAIASDASRLRQILTNLIQNAIKFTDSGEIRVVSRLVANGSASEPWLEISVEDTGIGIATEDRHAIFEPFTQLHDASVHAQPGTGLGLSLSRRLARLLGGDLVLASEIGRGSRFTVRVPATPIAEFESAGPDCSALEPKPDVRVSGRILIAEDGVDNRRLLRAMLASAGLEVELVENGEQACQRASEAQRLDRPFDVLLMDIQMPILDGYAATRRLRAEGYPGAIIALTARAMVGDRERCLEAGFDDYASKPIVRSDLIARISGSIAKSRGVIPSRLSRTDFQTEKLGNPRIDARIHVVGLIGLCPCEVTGNFAAARRSPRRRRDPHAANGSR